MASNRCSRGWKETKVVGWGLASRAFKRMIQASTLVGVLFETEGLGGVAGGLEEGFKMRGPEDLGQTSLVL